MLVNQSWEECDTLVGQPCLGLLRDLCPLAEYAILRSLDVLVVRLVQEESFEGLARQMQAHWQGKCLGVNHFSRGRVGPVVINQQCLHRRCRRFYHL